MRTINYSLIALVFLLFLIATFFPFRTARASEGTFLKYSLSANTERSVDQKGLSFGFQDEVLFFEKKWEVGFWFDNRAGSKNSAFASYSFGIEPQHGFFYANFFQGIGLISSPDSVLGGHAQFFADLGVGIRDLKKKVSLGFQYRHISSAGIFMPNLGRDTFGIQVMIPW
jgi:hypothetical protein